MNETISIVVNWVATEAVAGAAALSSSIKDLSTQVTATTGGMGNAFTNFGSMVSKAFTNVTSFIGDFINKYRYASLTVGLASIAMIKNLVDIGANVEQTRVAFATLLQSEPQAGNLMEWLTKYSLVTPLTRAQLQETARTFLAYGHNLDQTKVAVQAVTEATSALGLSQDRITAITQNLGKIFTSTQASLRHVNFEMWQGVPVGKLLAQAVNEGQISLAGFASTLDIATGKAVGGLKELTQEQIKAVLASNTGKDVALALENQLLKTFGGAALKQVKTFSGLMSNFADVFQYVVQKAMGISLSGEVIVGGAFYNMREAASALISFLTDHIEDISRFFNNLLSNKDVILGITGAIVGMLIPAIVSLIGPVVLFGGAIGFLIVQFKDLFTSLIDISPITGTTKELDAMKSKIQSMPGDVEKLRVAQEELKKKQEALKTALDGVVASFNTLKVSFKGLGDAIGLALDPTGKFKIGLNQVAVVVGMLILTLSFGVQVLSTFILGIRAAYEATAAWLSLLGGNLSAANEHLKNTEELGRQLGTSWSNWGIQMDQSTTKFAAAWANVDTTAGIGAQSINRSMNNISSSASIMSSSVSSSTALASTNVSTSFGQMNTSVDLNSTAMALKSIGTAQSISTSYQTQWPIIAGYVENAYNDKTGMLRAANEYMPKIESNTVGPLARIKNAFQDVINKIGDFMNKQAEAAKSSPGAGWPSISNYLPHGAHGMTVPGGPGEAVPIIAHGGERIVPSGGETGGGTYGGNNGGVNITFTGAVNMDSDQRVQQLADKVIAVIGRQNELSRYGVGFSFA